MIDLISVRTRAAQLDLTLFVLILILLFIELTKTLLGHCVLLQDVYLLHCLLSLLLLSLSQECVQIISRVNQEIVVLVGVEVFQETDHVYGIVVAILCVELLDVLRVL